MLKNRVGELMNRFLVEIRILIVFRTLDLKNCVRQYKGYEAIYSLQLIVCCLLLEISD
jgi:hypothetical protein